MLVSQWVLASGIRIWYSYKMIYFKSPKWQVHTLVIFVHVAFCAILWDNAECIDDKTHGSRCLPSRQSSTQPRMVIWAGHMLGLWSTGAKVCSDGLLDQMTRWTSDSLDHFTSSQWYSLFMFIFHGDCGFEIYATQAHIGLLSCTVWLLSVL